jgi:rhodanese-related sulfurtransferase
VDVTNLLNFIAQEWLLVATLVLLVVVYMARERIKSGRLVSPHEMTQMLNKGDALVVDLRDAAEFKAGHIVNSINLAYAKLNADSNLVAEHKAKTLILVDKMGQHAGSVGRKLGKEGFNVCRLNGGIAEWQAQTLPLVKAK